MLQFSEAVRDYASQNLEQLRKVDSQRIVVRAETWLVGDQYSRAEVEGHLLHADEPPERGGTGKGPSPIQHFLATLGFCEQVMVGRNAALLGLQLDSVRITVKGYFDRCGGHVEGRPNQGIDDIRTEVRIESPEPVEKIKQLMDLVERECYVLNTLKRGVKVSQRVMLNGTTVVES
jgi:uncharacterized OsmC-like protein